MNNKISVGSLIIGVWLWHLSHLREYVSKSLAIVGPKISLLFNVKDESSSSIVEPELAIMYFFHNC